MELTLNTGIQYLKGVGEKRAALYHKLHIHCVRDLLYHFPRDYVDLSNPCPIADAPTMESCAIRARLVGKSREQRIRAGLSIFKMQAEDDTGSVEITMFNCRYTVEVLKLDEEYIFYGKVGSTLLKKEMTSPMIYPVQDDDTILPIYPQTAGLNSKLMRANIKEALHATGALDDAITPEIASKYSLCELNRALRDIHFPQTPEDAKAARDRFVFEELLILAFALSTLHADNEERKIKPMRPASIAPFYASLPYSPTGAQLRCIEEAVTELCSETPMNRLVQGDVGSGKTLVAAACIYFACQSGAQSAVMVPTEILAEQHFATMGALLEPFGVSIALLTGSTKAKDKREILAGLADGALDLCIGTHALLSEGVDFHSLGLVVTDEQHRFGVAQRAKLSQKSENAHVLVMSATPIPRTLSLIIYGDLKLSVIDELPPGRQPVETLLISSSKRARAMGFIRKALEEGRQAYIVCPLIEQGEVDTGLKPAVEYAKALAENELREYRVGLLHGKMKATEKEETMRQFKSGHIHALVSTTVVEVGVDVPNATIILIENAERFGLSQLHQLRGRVGRGKHKSYCILVSDSRAGLTRERLSVMKETSDGFKVAEYDLQLRGPGDFFGYRQHGLPELSVASLADDLSVLQSAQDCAAQVLAGDPRLSRPEHRLLRQNMERMLLTVGERPN